MTGPKSTDEHGTPRITFLNRYFHPDHSATSQMLSDLHSRSPREGGR